MTFDRFIFSGLAVVLAMVGCEQKKSESTPVVASSTSSSMASSPLAMTRFRVEESGTTTIVMDAPKEKIRAETKGAAGSLEIDVSDLTKTRGEVKIDLSTIRMMTFAEADKNDKQTTHARTWLEVADGEDGKLDDKTKAANRFATYLVRSIERASAKDLAAVTAVRDGADDVRRVTLTARGELAVHGHRVERDAELEVAFRYDVAGPPHSPREMEIKTAKPFRVVLAEHDIKPRDGFGKLAKGAFHLLGTKVADEAEITIDLRAKSVR